MDNKKQCCAYCGHVTRYRLNGIRYECANKTVDPNGICDRFQENVSPTEIMRRIDKKMKELEKIEDGKFQLKKWPPLHQNYHIRGQA